MNIFQSFSKTAFLALQFSGLLLLAVGLAGCEDVFEAHPYDTKVSGNKNINEKNAALIEQRLAGKTSFRFAMISDTQRGYDDTRDAVKHINKRGDVDFVLHGGDFTEYGVTNEFVWQREILDDLNVPYVSVIGNHDCLGSGTAVYSTIFGKTDYAFTAGNVRFVCLNTNALEYDYSHPIPNFSFISEQLEQFPSQASRTVFLMHAAPESDVFNNNVCEWFEHQLNGFPNLIFCLNGHDHHFKIKYLFKNDVPFFQCARIQDRSYLLFTINETGYDYEVVSF